MRDSLQFTIKKTVLVFNNTLHPISQITIGRWLELSEQNVRRPV